METVCVLHVGTEKTGSTSLQQFLKVNLMALAERGVWVPKALVPAGETRFFNQLLVSTASHLSVVAPDDLQRSLGLSTMEMVAAHRAEVVAHLRAEAGRLDFFPATMIVSNEHVHSRLREDADVENLKALIAPFCSRFKVVVYLRRQDELARSLAVTAVRGGAREFRPVPDFSAGFDAVLGVDFRYFDYADLLYRLERVFGAAALDVRIYEGDVVEDFCARAGLEMTGLQAVGRRNTGMDEKAVRLLALLNCHAAFAGEMRGEVMAFLERDYAGQMAVGNGVEAARFLALFEAGNEAVRAKWFAERERLFAAPAYREADVPLLNGCAGGI